MKVVHCGLPLTMISLLLFSANVFADAWTCRKANLVREVVVEYPEGGVLPCNVIYKKQTEGVGDQKLWYAENTEGYCEDKAAGLVATIEEAGWICAETIGSQGGDSM